MEKENTGYKKFKTKFAQFILAIAFVSWGTYIYFSNGHRDRVEGILFMVLGIGYLILGITLNVRKEK